MSEVSPDKTSAGLSPARRPLTWYLFARMTVAGVFLGGAIFYHLHGPTDLVQPGLVSWMAGLIGLVSLQTCVSALILKKMRRSEQFVQAQVAFDLVFVLAIIFLTGGVVSLYSFLYILVIIAGSVFLSRRQLLIAASAASILYGSLLDLQFYRYLPQFGGIYLPESFNASDVFYSVTVNVVSFLLTALLSGYLAERLQRSERARAQTEIDYQELERLNRAILLNIPSGLMLVGNDGLVRSFNQAAENITGYRLPEVYHRPVAEIFPAFAGVFSADRRRVKRGELRIHSARGSELVLGYSASQVFDPNSRDLGLLITFQDLTEIKALEEQLRIADRLAAVGRLASGLVHEIRNPLASISGSVQMLGAGGDLSGADRSLAEIVVKETRRLNHLLGSFLVFAKPAPLREEFVDLSLLLDELVALLRAGGQSSDVTITLHVPPRQMVRLDRQKMYQALWDLLLNAVDAARPAGNVAVSVVPAEARIIVEDSGPGVDPALRERIFDPFFTTKDQGTGLGLANVHANVQAHDGRIEVGRSARLGGARFVITLPERSFRPDPEVAHVS